jgi:hypothetical protein
VARHGSMVFKVCHRVLGDAAPRNRPEGRSRGVRGARGGACPVSPRRRRSRERVCRHHRQVVGRSSGQENGGRRPFAAVASTVEVGYAVPEGVYPGKIGLYIPRCDTSSGTKLN